MTMLLQIECQPDIKVETFEQIANAVKALTSDGESTFLIVSRSDETYMQTARLTKNFIIEIRHGGSDQQYRARLDEKSFKQNLVKWQTSRKARSVDYVRFPNLHTEEILPIEAIIECFAAFFHDQPTPKGIRWAPISI